MMVESELELARRESLTVRANRHRRADEIIESILQAVSAFSGDVAQADDETLVILKVNGDSACTDRNSSSD